MKSIAVLGCGWLGLPVAEKLVANGYKVTGTTTTSSKLDLLKSKGIDAHFLNLDSDSYNLSFLTTCDTLFLNIPPGLRSNTSGTFLKKIERLIEQLKSTEVQKIVYANSSAVYPSVGVFNEQSTLFPDSEKGLELLDTELLLSNSTDSFTVIRLGGLFGPGRNPSNFIRSEKQLAPNTTANLIHLLDAVNLSYALLVSDATPKIVNGVHPHHPDKFSFYKKAYEKEGKTFEFNKPENQAIRTIEMHEKIAGFDFQKAELWEYL